MKHTTSVRFYLVVGLFCAWRILLIVISQQADHFLPYAPTFPYAHDLLAQFHQPRWLYSFANFDGVHYLTIVQKGYVGTGLIQAFFPLYPAIVKGATLFGFSNLIAALIVSNGALIAALLALFALARRDFTTRQSWNSVFALLLFPTALFLGSVYNESTFLLLVLLSFLAARRQRWLLAGVLAAGASATRVVGIALVPALLFEIYQSYATTSLRRLWQRRDFHAFFSSIIEVMATHKPAVVSVLVGALGLLGYMFYLQLTFGDAFYFLHVQSEFGASRSESVVVYPQVIWRYFKILTTAQPFSWSYYTWVLEALAGTLGLAGLIAAIGRVRASYLVFAFGAFIIPTLTGTFSSMPRYLLVCFPLFLLMGRLSSARATWVSYLVFSALLLIINTILFVQGFWVA